MKTLRTARLTLRPFTLDDAPAVHRHCSSVEVARNTLMIPHPYPDGAAELWISKHAEDWEENRIHHFALDDGQLAGAMGLIMKGDAIAELGYWIGVELWNRGYATEAAREVLRYGFEEVGLHRIFAGYFVRNAPSGRVMEKIGMRYEGTLRQHVLKWGEYQDVAYYGILRDEFSSRS